MEFAFPESSYTVLVLNQEHLVPINTHTLHSHSSLCLNGCFSFQTPNRLALHSYFLCLTINADPTRQRASPPGGDVGVSGEARLAIKHAASYSLRSPRLQIYW